MKLIWEEKVHLEPTELEALREPMRMTSLEQKLYSILDQMSYIGQ